MTASKLAFGMLTATLLAHAGAAQQRPQDRRYRPRPQEVEALVKRIEKGANKFKKSVDKALDDSRLNQTRTETEINTYVREFENATDRLKKNTRRGDLAEQDAREVLRRADRIDRLMDRYTFGNRAESNWDALRRDLDQLPVLHRFSWEGWGGRGRPGWTRDGNRDRDRDRDDRGRDDDRSYNYEEVRGIIAQIETGANRFNRSLADALNNNRMRNSPAEREIRQYVRDLESATDRLKQRAQQRQPISSETREVLQRGDHIDRFMRAHRLGDRAERDWAALRNDLNRLASNTRVA